MRTSFLCRSVDGHSLQAVLVRALLALSFAGVLQSHTGAATLDEIKKRGYMIVATEDDYRPFEFVQDGKPMGFDHELLDVLKKAVPFEIKQEIIP